MLLAVTIVVVGLALGVYSVILAAAATGTLYFFIKRQFLLAFSIISVFVLLSYQGVGSSVQVRVDTGDRRKCFWGIPVSYIPMKPESRNALLSLNDPQVPKRWVWCATKVGSNNSDRMVYSFYYEAAAWVDIDPAIAKLVVRDLANYVQMTHATHGFTGLCTIALA